MICSMDAMTMIWGLRKPHYSKSQQPSEEVVDLQRRAHVLLLSLDQQRARIVVPTVAVAEVLAGIERQRHGQVLAEIQKRFFCPPFDLKASALAAELWQKHRALPKNQQMERSILKADVLIIATAKTAGATVFYSHDVNSRKLAGTVMEARDLPTHSEDMFVDLETRTAHSKKPPEES